VKRGSEKVYYLLHVNILYPVSRSRILHSLAIWALYYSNIGPNHVWGGKKGVYPLVPVCCSTIPWVERRRLVLQMWLYFLW